MPGMTGWAVALPLIFVPSQGHLVSRMRENRLLYPYRLRIGPDQTMRDDEGGSVSDGHGGSVSVGQNHLLPYWWR